MQKLEGKKHPVKKLYLLVQVETDANKMVNDKDTLLNDWHSFSLWEYYNNNQNSQMCAS